LLHILSFLDRSQDNMDVRAILAGICFAGPIMLVHTRHLKDLLGRCKSSINGSLQQLGYVPLRRKSKARICITALLPALKSEDELLRQWTARCASPCSEFCFLSLFPRDKLPEIGADDLGKCHGCSSTRYFKCSLGDGNSRSRISRRISRISGIRG
jgi:hypothetical protein